MTGFGTSQRKSDQKDVSVVVKSVNGRFLDVRFHLPQEYQSLEQQLKKKVSQTFSRGTVDVYVNRQGMKMMDVHWDLDSAKKWLNAYRQVTQALSLPFNKLEFSEKLPQLPHVFSVRDQRSVSRSEQAVFWANFSKALSACEDERKREGKSLLQHLSRILKDLIHVVGRMESIRRKMKVDTTAKLNQRLQKLGLEGQVEPARFAQELVIYLDKGDIAEEIERLKEHLQMCQRYLLAGQEQGKKLDFYSQELLREVNTIGSKANNAKLTEQVILAKSLIEAFKEQVQNVE